MILFVSRTPLSREDATWVTQEIGSGTGMELRVAASVEQAVQLLRGQEFRFTIGDASLT